MVIDTFHVKAIRAVEGMEVCISGKGGRFSIDDVGRAGDLRSADIAVGIAKRGIVEAIAVVVPDVGDVNVCCGGVTDIATLARRICGLNNAVVFDADNVWEDTDAAGVGADMVVVNAFRIFWCYGKAAIVLVEITQVVDVLVVFDVCTERNCRDGWTVGDVATIGVMRAHRDIADSPA